MSERSSNRRKFHFASGLVIGVAATLAVGLVLLPIIGLLHKQAGALEQAYGADAIALVARLNAPTSTPSGDRTSQLDQDRNQSRRVSNEVLTDAGRNAYTGSCAICHGELGDGKGALGLSTFPPATDLRSPASRDKTDAELFWIVKNGLGFTAMPAFADQYPDADIVAILAYVRALQEGNGSPIAVPPSTKGELDRVDTNGSAARRGAAVYFAEGCQQCHGGFGEAPNELALQDMGDIATVVRQGRPGMPRFAPDVLSDERLKDLVAYLETSPNSDS